MVMDHLFRRPQGTSVDPRMGHQNLKQEADSINQAEGGREYVQRITKENISLRLELREATTKLLELSKLRAEVRNLTLERLADAAEVARLQEDIAHYRRILAEDTYERAASQPEHVGYIHRPAATLAGGTGELGDSIGAQPGSTLIAGSAAINTGSIREPISRNDQFLHDNPSGQTSSGVIKGPIMHQGKPLYLD